MDKEKITDPFVLKIMELNDLKQEKLNSPFDYGEVSHNVIFAEYAYLIAKIQYLLLKYNLDKEMGKNISEEEIKNYCETEKSKKSYSLRQATRYLLPSPMQIQWDSNLDILSSIVEIMVEIKEKYISDRFFKPLSEVQIQKCMSLHSYANYYDCIEGTQNYFKLKDMGIEEHMEIQKITNIK